MKKLALTVLGPILVVALAALAFVWWERGAPPGFRPEAVDVAIDTITRDHRGVRLSGTAHLQARLRQTAGDETFYVYPLLAKSDTLGREIHVLLRTQVKPDELYGFEDRTIEGFARPPGNLVDRTVKNTLQKKGYHFTDDFVLVEEWAPEPATDEAQAAQ
jgi:hypothetical protein